MIHWVQVVATSTDVASADLGEAVVLAILGDRTRMPMTLSVDQGNTGERIEVVLLCFALQSGRVTRGFLSMHRRTRQK